MYDFPGLPEESKTHIHLRAGMVSYDSGTPAEREKVLGGDVIFELGAWYFLLHSSSLPTRTPATNLVTKHPIGAWRGFRSFRF